MNRPILYLLSGAFFLLMACDKETLPALSSSDAGLSNADVLPDHCTSSMCAEDRVYQKNGRTYLWAGSDSSRHFDITHRSFDTEKLRDHGLDREAFPALVDPQYAPLDHPLHGGYQPGDRCIVVKGQNITRVYPYSLMTYHEVINDEIDGQPYMVCYCVLADFPGVYHRNICDQTITYGVSGYTYMNSAEREGTSATQAFILWDRETESLWNPLENMGISNELLGTAMRPWHQSKWEVLTWQAVQSQYPNAEVLRKKQDLPAVPTTATLTCSDFSCCSR